MTSQSSTTNITEEEKKQYEEFLKWKSYQDFLVANQPIEKKNEGFTFKKFFLILISGIILGHLAFTVYDVYFSRSKMYDSFRELQAERKAEIERITNNINNTLKLLDEMESRITVEKAQATIRVVRHSLTATDNDLINELNRLAGEGRNIHEEFKDQILVDKGLPDNIRGIDTTKK